MARLREDFRGAPSMMERQVKLTRALAATLALTPLVLPGTALACGPTPSCWMKSGPTYLKSVCMGYAKDRRTLKQIATYVNEPENIRSFGEACKKLHVRLVE